MDLFSQAQLDALRRLKDAFEQKLLDEDEYKAEKAKGPQRDAGRRACATCAAADDDDDFELVDAGDEPRRRRRADAGRARRRVTAARRGRGQRARDRRRRRSTCGARRAGAAARNPRRGEERVMLRCRRVYFGTAVRRDVTVVFAPSGVTMEWRSDESGLYVQVRLEPSNMKTFDMYHRSHNVRADDDAIDPTAPDAIRGLRRHRPAPEAAASALHRRLQAH